MTSTLEREREEQAKWRLLPHCSGMRGFDELLNGEFLPREALRAR